MTDAGQEMTDEVAQCLGSQVAALRQRISTANTSGNLDGLLAAHILHQSASLPPHLDPMADTWLHDNAHRLEEPSALAALGYGLSGQPTAGTDVKQRVTTGLRRLMQRDPFPGDRVSFLQDLRILFGVHLAAEAVTNELPQAPSWLRKTLADTRLTAADRLHELAQRHVLAALDGNQVQLASPQGLADGIDSALILWMISCGTAYLLDPVADAQALRKLVMSTALRIDPSNLTVPQAALMLWAADDIIGSSIDQMILSRSHLNLVLNRFHAAMRRWRWDADHLKNPVRWAIRSEREVQDVLWIMLRSTFDDVVDEDTLPKFGHSSYRADFGLPRLGVLVEAKYVYRATGFKDIEQQVMIDSIAYLKNNRRYKELVVFIYDESCSVEHHDLTRRTLLELDGIADVIIVSRPGLLPAPQPQ